MIPVDGTIGRLAVLVVAIAVLVAVLLWARRATSHSFFLGVLVGTGLVLSFDIVWVHWIFGLHHITNHQEDVVLEPLLVVTGLVFMWFGVTRERQHVR
jgi:threonine/homoserine/homoserine lactone efflux protein